MFILLSPPQQLFEHLQTLRLQFTGIHQLLIVLPPRAQVAFLRDELGGFAVVGFQKDNGFRANPLQLIVKLLHTHTIVS